MMLEILTVSFHIIGSSVLITVFAVAAGKALGLAARLVWEAVKG